MAFGKMENKTKKNFKENYLLNLDNSKTKKYIKWKPILNLDNAIKLTINWYKSFSLKSKKIKLKKDL